MINSVLNEIRQPKLEISSDYDVTTNSIEQAGCRLQTTGDKDRKLVTFIYMKSPELLELIAHKDDDVSILDIRSNRFFQMGHVKYAENYSCAKKFMSRRSEVRWTKDRPSRSCRSVIIYDENDLNEHSPIDALKFINHVQQSCGDVKLLAGGFSAFIEHCTDKHLERKLSTEEIRQYAHSPTHKESLSPDVMKASLSEIIPKLLYLGNELDARDKDTLKEHEITDIINVTSNVPFYFENKFKYHRLPASDSDKQDISQYFNEAFRIIEQARKRKGRVFIHCWAGVSRSVTIALMYLIKTRNIDVLDALKYIQEKRRIADPNLNFLGQLSRLKQNS